jgi:hypothetical protein
MRGVDIWNALDAFSTLRILFGTCSIMENITFHNSPIKRDNVRFRMQPTAHLP